MIRERDDEVRNGWPLGLGSLSSRISDVNFSDQLVVEATIAAQEQVVYASHRPPRFSSFSSFSSSNLDTESTASFFPDKSVSLGRLIGIKITVNRGRQQQRVTFADKRSNEEMSKGSTQYYGGLCVPLLHHVRRIGRSRSTSS